MNDDLNYIKEGNLKNISKPISIDDMKIITEQMTKSVCMIKSNYNLYGTGFFCLIPFPDKKNLLPVLITNNHIINEKDIKGKIIYFSLHMNTVFHKILINDTTKIYTNEIPYDITIIEVKDNNNDVLNINNFLDIDDWINEPEPNIKYREASVYLLHYPKSIKVECSPGVIKNINKENSNIQHLCQTDFGSSGAPIINLLNYKVIGVHKGRTLKNNWNVGTFIREPIEKIKSKYLLNKQINKYPKDEINIYKMIMPQIGFIPKFYPPNFNNNFYKFIDNLNNPQNMQQMMTMMSMMKMFQESGLSNLNENPINSMYYNFMGNLNNPQPFSLNPMISMNQSPSQNNDLINLIFERSDYFGKITVTCEKDEMCSSVINKYINKTGDNDISIFICNGKKLNEAFSISELGLYDGSIIFVVSLRNVCGAK